MEFTYCKLIDVLSNIHSGGTPSTRESSYWGGKIKWLSSGETSQRFISDTIDKITDEGVKNSSTKLASKGSIVMACAGQGKTRGQTSYLLDDMYINQSVIALETNESVLPLYLFYDLSSRYEELRGGSDASSTRGSITTTSLKNLSFKYPDLSTQQSIVDILWGYDSLIEANNRRIELLEQAAQELYKEWFVRFRFPGYENVKFEDGLPENWSYVRFGKAIEIIDGDRGVNYPKQEEFYPKGDCLFLNAGNVTAKGFDFSSCSYITKEKDDILRKGKLQHGDVVLTTRGTVGNVAFYNETMTFSEMRINSGMVILRNLGAVSTEYIYTALRHEYLQKLMTLYASGSAQPQLPIKDMKRMKIIKPDAKTMERFTEMGADIYNQISLLIMKNQTLAKQRDMLLPRLMSGKLEV